jgi:hypothetical protein
MGQTPRQREYVESACAIPQHPFGRVESLRKNDRDGFASDHDERLSAFGSCGKSCTVPVGARQGWSTTESQDFLRVMER